MTTTKDADQVRPLALGPLRAEPGTTVRGIVPADLGTLTVDVPLALVAGARPGPRVVITGGVHGGEFTGVDAAHRLAALLDAEEVSGQVLICIVANPLAAYRGRLNVSSIDGVNINRVFPGDPQGSPTERMAAWIFAQLIADADAYLDLHSGGIDQTLRHFVGVRLSGEADVDATTVAMARAVGIEDVIFGQNAEGGNSHAAAVRQGVPAILVETSQLGERDPAVIGGLVDGLKAVLRRLGVLESDGSEPAAVREWVWSGEVASDRTGLWYPEFTAGDDVTDGQIIGRIVDPADGREHVVHAPASGKVFYGMRGLTVVPGTELAAIASAAVPGRTAESLQTPSEPEVLS
jgi:predicted deacylase